MNLSEAELARYLLDTPAFFERHAEVLAAVRLTSPHGQRAVSLQERQMEMLRDKIKGLEHKIIEMIRASQDNEAIAERLHRFTRAILLTINPGDLPEVIVRELKHEFLVPRAALRLWGAADPYTALRFGTPGPYKLVRHPLYVGWFFAFWCTPMMTVTHLFFAIMTTAYILIAIQLEERDLMREHPEYADYRARTPMLIPFLRGRRRSVPPGVDAAAQH